MARWHLWALLLITGIGGYLRFYNLANPALWGDEAMTFHRTSADYRELLDRLQFDGFTPLHYELYWWIGKGMPIGSWAVKPGGWPMNAIQMRMPVAIAGVLMIPAIYFLARQIVGRKTALVAALFAACSAYLLVYSRDAKMYMPFWFLLTLHIGCLLWWLRVNTRIAWLAWLAAGVAALGYHPSGLALLLIEPLLAITCRRLHWKHFVLLVIGLVTIGAAPAGHYLGFSLWQQKTGGFVPTAGGEDEEKGDWGASGIDWVRGYQAGRTGPELVLHTATAFLYSWEWPKDAQVTEIEPTTRQPVIPPIVMTMGTLSFAVLVTLFLLGALPWSAKLKTTDASDRTPWWRKFLWLGIWLVVPTYGVFYCRSIADFSPPKDWFDYVAAAWRGYWWYVGGGVALIAASLVLWRPRPIVLLATAAMVTTSLALLSYFLEPEARNSEAFIRRNASLLIDGRRWILAVALVMLAPLCWYFSGRTLLDRLKKLAIFACIVAALYVACCGASEYWLARKRDFKAAIERDSPGTNWEEAWKRKCASVWMPRYMGFMWPAVAIAAAALLMRLPTWPVRTLAVMALLAPNLANGLQRIAGDSEPPLDRMAADIVLAQKHSDPVRTFCMPWTPGVHPGDGSMITSTGRYHLAVAAGLKPPWFENAGGPGHSHYKRDFMSQFTFRSDTSPQYIREVVTSASHVNRVIVWQRFDCQSDGLAPVQAPRLVLEYATADWFAVPSYRDEILESLGPGWTRKGWETIHVRQHWSWRERGICWRREYVKIPVDPSN